MGLARSRDVFEFRDTVQFNPNQNGLAVTREILELNDPTPILPFLYLGSIMGNNNPDILKMIGITHVLNTAYNITPNYQLFSDPTIKYKHILSDDDPNYNIRQHFEEGIAFIDECVASNGKIFVHCKGGKSRSVSIVIAYLMYRYHLSFPEAYSYVFSKRPVIKLNLGFIQQLIYYDNQLSFLRYVYGMTNAYTISSSVPISRSQLKAA